MITLPNSAGERFLKETIGDKGSGIQSSGPNSRYSLFTEEKHILVVDDDANCRFILRSTLEQHGYVCTEAENGIWALERLKRDLVDLIITDNQMPGMNGCEFVEILAQSPTKFPPVIMLTGSITNEVKARAIQSGVYRLLRKPLDFKEVLTVVAEALIQEDCVHG